MVIYAAEGDFPEIVLDAVFDPVVSKASELSRYPVEDRAAYADHVVRRPPTIRFRALVVNDPVDPAAARERAKATIVPSAQRDPDLANDGVAAGPFGRVGGTDFRDPLVSARINGPQIDDARASGLLGRLIALRDNRDLASVATPHDFMPYAVLTDLTYRPIGNGTGYEINGQFDELAIAETATVGLDPVRRPAPPRRDKTGAEADLGTKATTTPTEPANRSAAAVLLDYAS